VEAIDLYQCHSVDPHTPIEETVGALNDLVRLGHVRYVGCSNFPGWRVVQALWASQRDGRESFASLQPHYNLVHRAEYEREVEAVAESYGLGVIPYSPLAGGFLTGKYRRDIPVPENSRGARGGRIQGYLGSDQARRILSEVEQIAQVRGLTPSQVSLAWLLHRRSVTAPIIGPKDVEQLNDNIASTAVHLEPEELASLSEVSSWSP
jgi:aryl-alcohol dehydrogenase-like predicted oxidoreductase